MQLAAPAAQATATPTPALSVARTITYTYDAVGNRLTQNDNGTLTNYTYDIANRLTNVNAQVYTWDNNGNLTNDGTRTYTYTQANRVTQIISGTNTYAFAYNGLGDRLRQTINGAPTNYALDLNAGLTQVLSDGSATYLYGNGRIAQQQTSMQYFGADGLGSVRQMYNSSGQIIANHRYDPFGNTLSQSGVGTSNYGFTGEWTDATGLEYLRARYYAPVQGRFVTLDAWPGDNRLPMSYNAWLYVYANPVNLTDPSGFQTQIYGVSVSNKFLPVEQDLIGETFSAYADLLGGEMVFRRNVALRRVEQGWIERSVEDNAEYQVWNQTIILPPNLLYAALSMRPEPSHRGEFIILPPLNIYGPGGFPSVPKTTFPNQETVFKFILAHETTHALVTGNELVYQSFVDTFFPKRSACFPLSVFVDLLDLRDSPVTDPSIERSKNRATFRSEVLADAIAGYLFAPTLLGNKYANWIKNDLRKQLR